MAKTGITLFLLNDRRYMAIFIIVRRLDQDIVRQRKQLFMDTPIERQGITLLRVGPPPAFNQQRIPGEHPIIKSISSRPAVNLSLQLQVANEYLFGRDLSDEAGEVGRTLNIEPHGLRFFECAVRCPAVLLCATKREQQRGSCAGGAVQ